MEENKIPEMISKKEEKSPKNKNRSNILIAIFIAILLITLGTVLYWKIPKQNKLKLALNEAFTYLEKNIQDEKNIEGSIKLNIKSDDPSLKNIEKINIQAKYAIDYLNQRINTNMHFYYDEEPLIGMDIFGQEQNFYLSLGELYNQIIELPLGEEYDKLFQSNDTIEEQKTILRSLKKAFDISLKDSYFELGTKTIKGEKVDTTVLTINEDNLETIKNDSVGVLLKDQAFLRSLETILDISTLEIEETMQELLSTKVELGDEIKITLITKGLSFVSLELVGEQTITVTEEDGYHIVITDGNEKIEGRIKEEIEEDQTIFHTTFSYSGVTSEMEMTLKEDIELDKKKIENTVLYTELPEDFIDKITEKILESKGFVKLLEDFRLIRG